MASGGAVVAAAPRALLRALLRGLQVPWRLLVRHPVAVYVVISLFRELRLAWLHRRRFWLGRQRVLCATDEVDGENIQGCLLSTENLLTLGRVEKRTLFTRPLIDLLGGNLYLVQELLRAAQVTRRHSFNCMVMRWMPPDDRYHVLQAALNAMSSLVGPNYVHFNALDGEKSGLFKSTWYCVTITMPQRHENGSAKASKRRNSATPAPSNQTCTFTDMTRQPRASLRVTLVNESDLRKLADGKLKPPAHGFFNNRHEERYRILRDIARNFQMQLVRTPADGRVISSRSPFTNEKAHHNSQSERPDGGLIKRVQSVPNIAACGEATVGLTGTSTASMGSPVQAGAVPVGLVGTNASARKNLLLADDPQEQAGGEAGKTKRQADEENVFLRLHVPHFIGRLTESGGGAGASLADLNRKLQQRTSAPDLQG